MVENERTKCPLTSREYRMSGKNLNFKIFGFFGWEKLLKKNIFLGYFLDQRSCGPIK